MAQKFLTSIDLAYNELQKARLHNVAGDTGLPSDEGLVFFDTTAKRVKIGVGAGTGKEDGIRTLAYLGDIPTDVPLANITGADDLKKIEALSGIGLLKRKGDNDWELISDSLTIGSTEIALGKVAESLAGLVSLGFKGKANDEIGLEVVTHNGIRYLHTSLPFYSDKGVSAGGPQDPEQGGGMGDVTAILVGDVEHRPDEDGIVHLPAYPDASRTREALVFGTKRFDGSEEVRLLASDLGLGASLRFGTKTFNGSQDIEITAADLGLDDVTHFLGTSSTEITKGGSQKPTIDGSQVTPKAGDVVLYNGMEFILNTNGNWESFGVEGMYAIKSEVDASINSINSRISGVSDQVGRNVTAIANLTSGLTSVNGRVNLVVADVTSVTNRVQTLEGIAADFNEMFTFVNVSGRKTIRANYDLWSVRGITANGIAIEDDAIKSQGEYYIQSIDFVNGELQVTYGEVADLGSASSADVKRIETLVNGLIDGLKDKGDATTPVYFTADGTATPCTVSKDQQDGDISLARKYVRSIIGDASKKSFAITHNLGSKRVAVLVYDSSYNQVMTDVTLTSANSCTLGFNVAPATGVKYNVVVIG